MTRQVVLGVDGGATKTECAVGALDGNDLAVVRGGASNYERVGFDEARRCIGDLARQALDQADADVGDVAAACFALAGMDLPPDREIIRKRIIDPIALACPIEIVNDAFAAFRAGSPRGVGVCASLGTGGTFCGRNAAGGTLQFEFPKPDGIDRQLLDALVSEYHGIGPHCAFGDEYLAAIGIENLEQLYWSVYGEAREYTPKRDDRRVEAARPIAFQPKYHDDPGLCAILTRYARDLAELLVSMAKRLDLKTDEPFDLVLSGSVLTKGRHPALNDTLIRKVRAVYPNADGIVVDGVPVQGALRTAREMVGPS